MLTPAQQKVKQELEELHTNALICPDATAVTPRQQFPIRKRILLLIGIILLLIISSLIFVRLLTPNSEKIVTYLAKEQQYTKRSERLLNDCMENRTASVSQKSREQAKLLNQLSKLTAPSSMKNHKLDMLDVLKKQQEILTYLSSKKDLNVITLNKKVIELNIKKELAAESLLLSLEQEKIRYVLEVDGSVQYWVNGKSYHY